MPKTSGRTRLASSVTCPTRDGVGLVGSYIRSIETGIIRHLNPRRIQIFENAAAASGTHNGRSQVRAAWNFMRMAGAPGFEPGNAGTKNRCLTAWRRPNARRTSRPATPCRALAKLMRRGNRNSRFFSRLATSRQRRDPSAALSNLKHLSGS